MSSASSNDAPPEIRWFSKVNDAFDDWLAGIRSAERTVCFEMYIHTDCEIGRKMRDALTEAAGRGVRVRVLIDAMGSMTLAESFWSAFQQAGGEFRWFNPFHLERFTIRNHRKLLVVDERTAWVGGFNVAAEYEGNGITQGWFDLGVSLTGALVPVLARSFEQQFALADFQHHRFARFRRLRRPGAVSTPVGQLLVTSPGLGRNQLLRQLLQDLKSAREVRIITAYFLPTRSLRQALLQVVRRGGRVKLLMPGKSDVAVSQLASRRFYHGLLRESVRIFEYQPQVLHAKLFVIDDLVYVGSANLDRRSLTINYELLLRLHQPGAVSAARAIFDAALERALQIQPREWSRQRSIIQKWKELWSYWLLARFDPFLARRQMRKLQSLR